MLEGRAGGEPQLRIARCFEEKAPWVASKCTLSPWGVTENHLVGRLLFPFRGALVDGGGCEAAWDSATPNTLSRSFWFFYICCSFTPSSSRDDNISVGRWNWGRDTADGTKCHYIMGLCGSSGETRTQGFTIIWILPYVFFFFLLFPPLEMHFTTAAARGENGSTSAKSRAEIF